MLASAVHGVRFEQVCWDGGLRCRASQNERGSGTLDFGSLGIIRGLHVWPFCPLRTILGIRLDSFG